LTVRVREQDGDIRAFETYEVKAEGAPLDVQVVEQLSAKLHDMPEVTHRAIVSTSGFTDGAISKAASHNVELYHLRPWSVPQGQTMPTFSGQTLPMRLGGGTVILLCWNTNAYVHLHLASDRPYFRWTSDLPAFSASGGRHSMYATLGDFRQTVLLRSTEALVSQKGTEELLSLWPKTSLDPSATAEIITLGSHTHTVDVASDDVHLKLDDALVRVDSVSISGDLEWHRSGAVPDFRLMERVPGGEPYAGAAVVPVDTPDMKMAALVFAPSSPKIGIHFISLGRKHQNAIRRLRLLVGAEAS